MPDRPPYAVYAAIVGLFGATVAGAGAIANLRGERPERLGALDLVVLSAAGFKVARTAAHDEVLSFLRAPFVEGEAHEGDEEPVHTGGPRQALGEMLTCSRCIGTWSAAGLVAAQTLAPRTGRLLTWTLAVAGANDFLQAAFTALTAKSNELEQRTGGA